MGASRDFLTSSHSPQLRLDPQSIFTQNGSNDVDSRKDVPFAVKIVTFYRAMHFSAKRGIAIACRLSVRLSVCLWRWWIVIT